MENDDDVAKNEVCRPDGDGDFEEYEQEEYTCVIRKLVLSSKYGDETQRHKLFRTRCTMQWSLCDIIIDSRSQENIISKNVMEKLQLEMETHPMPHAIGWINEVSGIQMNEHCKVFFSISKYNFEVYYDEWIWMVVIFYLSILGSMMWMLSTRIGVTCIN